MKCKIQVECLTLIGCGQVVRESARLNDLSGGLYLTTRSENCMPHARSCSRKILAAGSPV